MYVCFYVHMYTYGADICTSTYVFKQIAKTIVPAVPIGDRPYTCVLDTMVEYF
jgi:hypothetical protein